jgi:hypothetical protein
MNQPNKLISVFLLLIAALSGIALIVFSISYFELEHGGIIQSQGEFSFGMTSKLGWILTIAFFGLLLFFSLIRHLYFKLTGRG